jgi:hypothetical protein
VLDADNDTADDAPPVPSATLTSLIVSVGVDGGATSSLVMVAWPVPSAIVAFTGLSNPTVNASFGSATLSVTSGTVMGCTVTPGANVSVPDVAA